MSPNSTLTTHPGGLCGPDAYSRAERKTRHPANRDLVLIGHKGRDGNLVAEVQSVASVRRALLAVGTRGSIRQFVGGHRLKLGWRASVNLLYQLKHPAGAGPALPGERPAEYRRNSR